MQAALQEMMALALTARACMHACLEQNPSNEGTRTRYIKYGDAICRLRSFLSCEKNKKTEVMKTKEVVKDPQ